MNSFTLVTPNFDDALKANSNISLFSTISGFESTATNGIIDATPNISKKAIIRIIAKTTTAFLRSSGERRRKFFLEFS